MRRNDDEPDDAHRVGLPGREHVAEPLAEGVREGLGERGGHREADARRRAEDERAPPGRPAARDARRGRRPRSPSLRSPRPTSGWPARGPGPSGASSTRNDGEPADGERGEQPVLAAHVEPVPGPQDDDDEEHLGREQRLHDGQRPAVQRERLERRTRSPCTRSRAATPAGGACGRRAPRTSTTRAARPRRRGAAGSSRRRWRAPRRGRGGRPSDHCGRQAAPLGPGQSVGSPIGLIAGMTPAAGDGRGERGEQPRGAPRSPVARAATTGQPRRGRWPPRPPRAGRALVAQRAVLR